MNAQQHHLTGVCVLHGNTNLVVVEGGPKGIQKYKNLMLRRINWDDKVSENDNEGDEDGGTNTTTSNECLLVWEGLKPIADFRGFRFRQCPTEQKVKEALGENCLTYWDLARSFKPTTA
jgi:U4/U6 small nuclear ribonucleoprotein PRP3